jgi:hypothetical protein
LFALVLIFLFRKLFEENAEGGNHLRGSGAEDEIEFSSFAGRHVAAAGNEQNGRAGIAAAESGGNGGAVGPAESVAKDGQIPAGGRYAGKGLREADEVERLKTGLGNEAGARLHQQGIISNLKGSWHRGVALRP